MLLGYSVLFNYYFLIFPDHKKAACIRRKQITKFFAATVLIFCVKVTKII